MPADELIKLVREVTHRRNPPETEIELVVGAFLPQLPSYVQRNIGRSEEAGAGVCSLS
jgi:hypothetical protein